MTEYRLAFEVNSALSVDELSKDFYEHLNGLLVERAGQIIITVYLEGASAVDAAHTAIDQLEKLDLSVCHADLDLVDGPEISTRLGVTRQLFRTGRPGSEARTSPTPSAPRVESGSGSGARLSHGLARTRIRPRRPD